MIMKIKLNDQQKAYINHLQSRTDQLNRDLNNFIMGIASSQNVQGNVKWSLDGENLILTEESKTTIKSVLKKNVKD